VTGRVNAAHEPGLRRLPHRDRQPHPLPVSSDSSRGALSALLSKEKAVGNDDVPAPRQSGHLVGPRRDACMGRPAQALGMWPTTTAQPSSAEVCTLSPAWSASAAR